MGANPAIPPWNSRPAQIKHFSYFFLNSLYNNRNNNECSRNYNDSKLISLHNNIGSKTHDNITRDITSQETKERIFFSLPRRNLRIPKTQYCLHEKHSEFLLYKKFFIEMRKKYILNVAAYRLVRVFNFPLNHFPPIFHHIYRSNQNTPQCKCHQIFCHVLLLMLKR